ncbi:unnamed protein product [Durusdinium trenchii]|uniref:Uncharacterized protein n=1 Tax=Durusdinium trenchii TaxID=1381693 RepID=A0ABP0HIE6_9DINO
MCFQSFHIWSKTLCGSTEAGLGFLHDHSGKLYTRHKCSLKDIVVNKQAVMAVFRGLKKYPAPQGMNMYRLSAHELCKALLAFFDGGGYWPSGLHSQIPACQEWALKTARGLVKLVSRMRRLITRAPISKMSKLNEIRDEITALKLPADGDDGSDTGTSTTNSDISALSASSKSSPAIDLESLSRKDDRLCRLIQQAQDQRRRACRAQRWTLNTTCAPWTYAQMPALRLRWLLEQPLGTIVNAMPGVQRLWEYVQAYKTTFWMGNFGHSSCKSHMVWSNDEGMLNQLVEAAGYMSAADKAQKTTKLVRTYIDCNGKRRCTGLKKELKESQRYPDDFGTWLATLVKHRSSAQLPPPKKTIELDGDFSDAEHFLDKCTKVLTAADGFPLLGISGDPCVEDFWQRF